MCLTQTLTRRRQISLWGFRGLNLSEAFYSPLFWSHQSCVQLQWKDEEWFRFCFCSVENDRPQKTTSVRSRSYNDTDAAVWKHPPIWAQNIKWTRSEAAVATNSLWMNMWWTAVGSTWRRSACVCPTLSLSTFMLSACVTSRRPH